jgi:hypothetical protein
MGILRDDSRLGGFIADLTGKDHGFSTDGGISRMEKHDQSRIACRYKKLSADLSGLMDFAEEGSRI